MKVTANCYVTISKYNQTLCNELYGLCGAQFYTIKGSLEITESDIDGICS